MCDPNLLWSYGDRALARAPLLGGEGTLARMASADFTATDQYRLPIGRLMWEAGNIFAGIPK
jgi:hypothetical protein